VSESGNNLLSCTYVLTPVSTQVQKKAPFNPVESIIVTKSGNNLLSCTSVLISGCRIKLYYPLYSGWTFPCIPHFFLRLERHVLGHSLDSRGIACQTFGAMAFTQNSSSLSESLSQTTPHFKSVPRMASSPPRKKRISSEGASSSIYLTWTTQYHCMSRSIPQSSVSWQQIYSIQGLTINCPQPLPTG
jgi:hypothetical protein